MNAPERMIGWTEANQRLLVAEFGRLKARLSGGSELQALADRDSARAAMHQPPAIDRLVDAFGLSPFERDLVLLTAGVEMDSSLAALCAGASDMQVPWATFGLALATLDEPHWSAFAPPRPLRRWRLVEPEKQAGLASAKLRVDERIVHFLAGLDYFDARLESLLRPLAPAKAMAAGHAALSAAIAEDLASARGSLPVIMLSGDDAHGREDIAADCATRLGLRLYSLAAPSVPADRDEIATLIALWEREAVLESCALLVGCGDDPLAPAVVQLAEQTHGLVFLSTGKPAPLRRTTLQYEVDYPSRAEQRQLWERALGAPLPLPGSELDAVAAQFRLSARNIAETAAALAADGGRADSAALWRACRRGRPSRLSDLAQRIEPVADWTRLILPDAQRQILSQIAVHMRHRFTVYDDWGFASHSSGGIGVSALFAGESGTGKTLAAEVLAHELHLDLYRIDLAAVVSKYIGETEKNLSQVFDAAEGTGAMLLFDEADALFGKRSEVKDSHDRYANIEVSFLLQRMEAFHGLAILTTNNKTAIDGAFIRRLRFVVQFSFPDLHQREAIWRASFPASTPLQDIDWAKLARLNVTGGTIRNVALAAAFLAAEQGAPVTMSHLLRAAGLDAAKREKSLSDAEIRGWA
jgi:hypothetical protein